VVDERFLPRRIFQRLRTKNFESESAQLPDNRLKRRSLTSLESLVERLHLGWTQLCVEFEAASEGDNLFFEMRRDKSERQ